MVVDCQMVLAKDNILKNQNCSIISYDEKKEMAYKLVGKARYTTSGENFDKAVRHIKDESYTAKGAVTIEVEKVIKIQ